MFASEEAEEEVKRESAKIVPAEIPQEAEKEEQTPKVSAPTPEQILAIKVIEYSLFSATSVILHIFQVST